MSTVGLSQILPLALEKDVDTLWTEFDLGSLLNSQSDNNDLSLEKKIQNDTVKKLMHSKHPLHKHQKEWSQPQYAVLKARYNSIPIDPPVLDPKKIDRLADPIRGRYRNYDELKAEIEQEENDIQNIIYGNDDNSDMRQLAQRLTQYVDGDGNPETENNEEGDMYIPQEFLIDSPSKRKQNSSSTHHNINQNTNNINIHTQNLFNMIQNSPMKINRNQQTAFFLTEADDDNKSINSNRSQTIKSFVNGNVTANPININASKFKQKLMNNMSKNNKQQAVNITKNKIQKRDKNSLKNQLLNKKSGGKINALGFNSNPAMNGNVPARKIISSGYGGAISSKKKLFNTKTTINSSKANISTINNISVLDEKNKKMSRTSPAQARSSAAKAEGTSMQKSMHRAKSMVQLLPGGRVKKQRPSSNYESSVSPDKTGRGRVAAAANKKRGTKSAPSLLESKTSGRLNNSRNNISLIGAINSTSQQKDIVISTTAATKARKPMFTTAKLNADIVDAPQRNTSELLTILEEVSKKEVLRKNTNHTDSDNINQLTLRIKNIGSKLENATNLSMKYKELANEDIKFRS